MSTVPSTTAAAAASSSSQYAYPAANGSYFPTPFHLQQAPPQPPVPFIGAAPPPVPTVTIPVYPAAPTFYSLPQYQQAQQLFQRDAQTITPEVLESVKAALASSDVEHKAETKKKVIPRKAAGQTWEDPTLADWPENDYRLFCGDLGNEANDDILSKAFTRFPSFNMARVHLCKRNVGLFIPFPANIDVYLKYLELSIDFIKVVRDKRTGKTKGYGFVSFSNPTYLAAVLNEMNGKESMLGTVPLNFGKAPGRKGPIMKLPGAVLKSVSQEDEATKEKRVAQMRI